MVLSACPFRYMVALDNAYLNSVLSRLDSLPEGPSLEPSAQLFRPDGSIALLETCVTDPEEPDSLGV